MSIENNKYKDHIDELLEDYFANITSNTTAVDEWPEYQYDDPDLTEALNYGLSKLDEEISEEEFNKIKSGDIILLEAYQQNFDINNAKHITRPFLVTNVNGTLAYGFVITTIKPEEKYAFQYLEIDDYSECGLTKQGYIELERTIYCKRFYIRGENPVVIGHITEKTKNKLSVRMSQIQSSRNWLENLTYAPNKVILDIDKM